MAFPSATNVRKELVDTAFDSKGDLAKLLRKTFWNADGTLIHARIVCSCHILSKSYGTEPCVCNPTPVTCTWIYPQKYAGVHEDIMKKLETEYKYNVQYGYDHSCYSGCATYDGFFDQYSPKCKCSPRVNSLIISLK